MKSRDLALGTKIILTLGFLATVVTGIGYVTITNNLAYRASVRAGLASNQIGDHLIRSTASGAMERGITALLIAMADQDLPEKLATLRAKIADLRSATDREYQAGYAKAQALLGANPNSANLEAAITAVAKSRLEFEQARQRIDGGEYPSAEQWVEIATRFIERQTELRLASILPSNPVELAIEVNLRLKHLVWEASEYAGRERANIAKLIADQRPVDPQLQTKLNGWRFTVEKSLKDLQSYQRDPGVSEAVRTSIQNASTQYLGQFENVRKRVLASSESGRYTISGENWVKESTAAINALLAINTVVSSEQAAFLDKAHSEANQRLGYTGFFAFLSVLFCVGAALWFQTAVLPRIVEMIQNLRSNAQSVNEAARQIASGSESQAQATTQQAASLAETAAAVEELSSMIKRNSESAEKAKHIAGQTATSSREGQGTASEMGKAVAEIGQSYTSILGQVDKSNAEISEIVKVIKQISEKTKVIHEIVFQTKLLSFNASVEAARAGEHGKGFAVVAEEVGNLARMSGSAAKEITDILSGSVEHVDQIVSRMKSGIEGVTSAGKQKVDSGVELVAKCQEILTVIGEAVEVSSQMSDQIASASAEQAKGTEEINKAVAQLDQVTHENSAGAEESARAAEELSHQADSLNQSIGDLSHLILGSKAIPTKIMNQKTQPPAPLPKHPSAQGNVIPIRKTPIEADAIPTEQVLAAGGGAGFPPARNDPRF
ncbi:MAG: methyl-accepting chemotaxis protein [Bdellovibrionota bacterium]